MMSNNSRRDETGNYDDEKRISQEANKAKQNRNTQQLKPGGRQAREKSTEQLEWTWGNPLQKRTETQANK